MPRHVKPAESRQSPRLKLPPMYTLVRVRAEGEERFRWTGYIYDISSSGMRFELDNALDTGTRVEVRAMLPGSPHTTFSAVGQIVRHHDDAEELGPRRMGVSFEQFAQPTDRRRLFAYLDARGIAA